MVLEQLMRELEEVRRKTVPSSTPSTPYYTGPAGLFGVSGLDQQVISTHVSGQSLLTRLPFRATTVTNPLFPALTGFRDVSGSQPTGPCDDPQTAGSGKSCIQTAVFGRYSKQTRVLERNRLGQQINRGEFRDLTIVNNPIVGGGPDVPGSSPQALNLLNEVQARFLEVGVALQREIGPQVYVGNPSNNTGSGGYEEFPGLDILIGTGKVDAITGTTCPSLDSLIRNFNYGNISTSTAAATNAVAWITAMVRYFEETARSTGLAPIGLAMVMRRSLFYELTAAWPCSYLTYRCNLGSNGQVVNVDARDQVEFRDSMRRESYLLIDGQRYEVIIDDFIDEDTNTENGSVTSGCFASDIYFVPLTVAGLYAGLFGEYFNYQGGALEMASPRDFWSDGGRFLWHHKPPTNWCEQWVVKTEPRLILRTPHLAGRLTNVQYCPLIHERDVDPDSAYHVNGGVTSRVGPSNYSEWQS